MSIVTEEIEQSYIINNKKNIESKILKVKVLLDKSKQLKKQIEKKKKEKVNLFILLTRRSNIYQNLYFEDIIYKYAIFVNCNIFIEEDKYRFFKAIVAYINSINIKETLLIRENMQQTIRFILNRFFENIKDTITI